MTLNLSGTTNNLLLQLLILVYFLLLIKQCYYLLCEKRKNTSQSDLNGQNYPEGDELIKAKDIQFNEFPPFTPRKTGICRAQQKLSTMFLAILFNVIS